MPLSTAANQSVAISNFAITTGVAILALLFGGGWFARAAWTALRATIRDDFERIFMTRADASSAKQLADARLDAMEARLEATEVVVNEKLVGAVETFAVSLAKLETLHDERHRQSQATLMEIRDELRNLRKD
jgi:hypothetical protein